MKIDIKPILENALALIEVEVEKGIEAKSDAMVDLVLEEVKKLIPGDWENPAIESIKPVLKPKFKALLLAQAEKISDKV